MNRAVQRVLLRNGIRSCQFYCTVAIIIILVVYLVLTILNVFFLCRPLPPDVQTDQLAGLLRSEPKSVVILIMATGHYFQLGLDLIESSEQFFCKNQEKAAGGECSNITYLFFTDVQQSEITLPAIKSSSHHEIRVVQQARLGWPDDSMKRYHTYLKQHAILEKFDFVWALDADLRFVTDVQLSDVYGDLVAVLHPGYVTSWRIQMPFERKESRSKAYVAPMFNRDACYYFTGANWGGQGRHFVKALRSLVWQLDSDAAELGVNFTAAWHDESHLNRYLVENAPTRVLSPSYYYPETHYAPKEFDKKIIARDKDHRRMRDE